LENRWFAVRKKHPLKSLEKKLSLKAIGLLFYLITTNAHISAESLAKEIKEGEHAIGVALKELRDAGFLELKKTRTPSGLHTKKTTITPSGYAFFTECLTQINTMAPNFFELFWLLPIEETTKMHHFGSELHRFQRGRKEGDYAILSSDGFNGFSSAEIREMREESALQTRKERERLRKKVREDFIAYEKSKRAKKKMERDSRYRESWTATDMSFEFSDRCQNTWMIPPWEVGQSRFRMMQSYHRKRYDTNGEIECQMMDRFFATENIAKYPDANYLMGRYFKRYSELLSFVKTSTITEEEIELIKIEARKGWAKFNV